MDSKKISFGFSKVTKKSNLLPSNKEKEKSDSKIELIKCLEGQEIKLVEEKKVDAPMIIPLKENTKTSAALASLMKRRAILLGEADEPPPKEQPSQTNNGTVNSINRNNVNETLEERAARELIASVQSNDHESIDQNLVLPALKADELPLDGAKQSTIDDYDNVPIEQFGKAMLRGMGWTEPIQKKGEPADEMPFVRPKGMGLGADKALKKHPLLVAPEKNEILEIKKQAYVRILGGKHKDMYGQIEGFDDHAGRVIVKMAIGGNKEAFNEFLCQPISKKEYAQYGKCINTVKYEEYKRMENEHGQIIIKKEDNDKKHSTVKGEFKSESKKEDDYKRRYENRDNYKHDEQRDNYENSENTTQKNRHDNGRDRFDHQSSSRRQQIADRSICQSNGSRVEGDRRRDGYRGSSARHYELDEQRSSYHRRERDDDRRKELETSKRRSRERSSRTEHEERVPSASNYSRRQQYTDDTSASSGTDSDSDSAYERKLKKKSSHKSKSKKKSSKKSKRNQRHRTTDTESSSNSDDDDDRHEKKLHKKKTKKSKKPRSRSRSHDRASRR